MNDHGTTGTTTGETAPHREDGVVVVGAGPTGLLLAGDLAEADVPVTVVEKRAPGLSNLSRAFVLHARTLEQLDTRGLADGLIARGHTLETVRLFNRLAVRIGGLASPFPFVLVIPQYEIEAVLQRRAAAAGARFVYGTEVTGLSQDAAGVTLRVAGPGSATGTLRAAYAVGTDGMRSTVRRAVGLRFPGTSVLRSMVLADVRLTEEPPDLLTVDARRGTMAFVAPFGDGWYRVIGWQRGRRTQDTGPVAFEEVREITRRALGRDFGMHDPRWMSRFHSDERQAPAYRSGRVLLAGDAAHVHSPAGGQGMNTGLQDAANLGWKLAAVLAGGLRAPERLLDTYHAERHPVGRSVLRSSGTLMRLARGGWPWLPPLRLALTTLLRAVPPLRALAIGRITGIGYRYPAPRGSHPLTGTRLPDVPLAGGGRLHTALRGGRFALLAPASAVLGGYGERVAVGHWADDRADVVLVRPDGYVAWAATAADRRAVDAAVTEWAGGAAVPAV